MAERYVAGEEGTKRLVGLIKSFTELKGNMLTISVADTAVLKEAQKNPEKYRDLRVRMGGWSAYFTMLSPEQQAHHIKKSESGFF
jgi:formate C-acetyltransferase